MASVEGVNPGYYGRINWFIDSVDDVLLADGVPSFEGGQFSNLRANLLQPNQSKQLTNCDVDRLGKLRTRRGTISLGTPSGVAGTIIQGLTSYQTKDYNYIVAANNAKLWAYTGSAWVQIGLGGTADGEQIYIARQGKINQPTVSTALPAGGYAAGTTVMDVDSLPAATAPLLAPGEKLYFVNNLRTDYYEYTIASFTPGAHPPSDSITLEEPGLVFDVKDNWIFAVLRPAKVANPTPGNRYAGGATSIAISGYTGAPAVGELFVIKSENVTHTLTAGSTNVLLNFTPALQGDWAAGIPGTPDPNVAVIFAQGNDSLYFTDGTGPIYGWTGGIPSSSTTGSGTLMQIGSHSILDDLAGSFVQSRTKPPQDVKVLLWFQNRLIASGIGSEPDAIYFSDYFNGGAWDQDYQKIRIGGGESDPITGLLAWTDLNMIVFKKNSCYLINLDPSQNPDPSDPTLLVASFAVKQLHKLIGCPAPLTAIQVGGGSTTPGSDVFFVDGDKKVHSIRRVMAAETQQEVGQAMSLPIQDVLDRINIAHIDRAVAMYHNEHYILGFPDMGGVDGGALPNLVAAYNLLTQSWCGTWSWAPTCFSRRTDLGAYSRLILGDWRGGHGNVIQWMDDLSLDEETDTTYQDWVPPGGIGAVLTTSILTRAFTGGDMYSFKTGLSVEFEFDESVASNCVVQVILDKVPHPTLIAYSSPGNTSGMFETLSDPRLTIPFVLGDPLAVPPIPDVVLPGSPGLLRKAFDLQRYGTWRELQFHISTAAGKLAIRSIRITFFLDTVRLQTVPMTGVPGLDIPPSGSSGGP